VQTLSPVGATESGVGRVPEDATCGTQRDGQPFRSGARTVCVCAQPERWTQAGLGGSLSMRRQRASAHRPATRTRRAAGIPTTCSCAAAAAPARSCCRCSPTWCASVATTARSAPPDDTTRRTRRQLHEPRRPADRPTAVVSLTAQQVLLVNAPLGGRMVAPRRSTSAGDASLWKAWLRSTTRDRSRSIWLLDCPLPLQLARHARHGFDDGGRAPAADDGPLKGGTARDLADLGFDYCPWLIRTARAQPIGVRPNGKWTQ
jgi:hypothetical protein